MIASPFCYKDVRFLFLVGGLVLLSSFAHALTLASDRVSCTTPGANGADLTYRYGPSAMNQVADVYLPRGTKEDSFKAIPVVVLVHGGYWYEPYTRASTNGSDMRPLVLDLQTISDDCPYVVVNIEYRRVGPSGGGVPATLQDLTNAVDALACVQSTLRQNFEVEMDLQRIAMVGHSAGGHLALWRTLQVGLPTDLAQRMGLQQVSIHPKVAVGLAAVSDFQCPLDPSCPDRITSCQAIRDFVSSGRKDNASLEDLLSKIDLELVSPLQMLTSANAVTPHGSKLHFALNHGTKDNLVGNIQSKRFYEQCQQFENVESVMNLQGGEDHFAVINPKSASWNNFVKPYLRRILFDETTENQNAAQSTSLMSYSEDQLVDLSRLLRMLHLGR